MCMSTAKTKHPKNQKQAALHMVESEIRGEWLQCELQGNFMLIPRLSGYAFIIHLYALKKWHCTQSIHLKQALAVQ